MEEFLSNTGIVYFEGLLYLLIYIGENKNLWLKYYDNIENAPLSDLLIHTIIKTDNQWIVFFDSSWQDCSYNDSSTGAYIVFYQGGPIYHCTHVPGPVDQSSAKSEYNAACTSRIALTHFMMLNNELSNKDPYEVPEQARLIILYSKSAIGMDKNGKDNKHTIQIPRRINFVRNGEEWNFHKTVWCEGGLQLADIGTNNVRENKLNARLVYYMVRLDNWQRTFQRGVKGYRRVGRKMCSEWLDWIELRTQLNEF